MLTPEHQYQELPYWSSELLRELRENTKAIAGHSGKSREEQSGIH